MVTVRKVVVEKHSWNPVNFDDGTSTIVALLVVAGLALIAYFVLSSPSETVMSQPTTPNTSTLDTGGPVSTPPAATTTQQ